MTGTLIVKSVFRKTKKQSVLIFCFMFLAAMLLNLWLMLVTDYKQNYFRHVDEYNGEHEAICFQMTGESGQRERVEAVLAQSDKVAEFSAIETASYYTSFPFADDKFSLYATLYSRSDAGSRDVGRLEFIEDSGASGIYLSYYYLAGNYYEVGDEFTLSMNGAERVYRVAGFYQTTSGGSSAGSKFMPFVLSDDCYAEAMDAFGKNALRVFVRLTDAGEAEKCESEIVNSVLSQVPGLSLQYSSYLQRMSASRYSIETVAAGVLGGSTLIAVAVLLTVIAICLTGCVRSNVRSFGMLKAAGYVSRQLILPIVLVYAAGAAVISCAGTAVSYAVFPVLNRLLEKQVALTYSARFLPLPAAVSVLTVTAVVILTVFLSIIGIRSVRPLMAIRGVKSAGARSTAFPLDKTALRLNTALAMKSAVSALPRNAVIFISMLLVSLLIGFSCFCYQYVVKDPGALLRLILEDSSDASFTVPAADAGAAAEMLKSDEQTQYAYRYDVKDVNHVGGSNITAYVVEQDGLYTLSYALLEGRYPEGDDEIALNRYYAEHSGLRIGSVITLSADGKQSDYIITGLIQGARYSGRSAVILPEGIELIAPQSNVTYQVKLKDGADIDGYIEEVCSKTRVLFAVNNLSTRESLSSDYSSMLSGLAVAVIFFSLGIVVFVLYILISMLLEQKRREHGILKAIGFETKQIIFQTAFSFLPLTLLGEIAGFFLARRNVGMLLCSMLHGIGIYSFDHPIAAGYLVFSAAALLLFSFAASCMLSAQIRKITPHSLFNRE